ncbi:MAG: glycosyltransferase family 2 protein [Chloroflexota bacterium]|nr:glycosyltransferase family 2 protein [Chloroflexota bacterium]
MKLSIVIPARNEAGNIEKTVVLLRDHLDKAGVHDHEILVVDDGSKDQTYDLVAREHAQDPRIRVIRNTGRNGYGRAVAFGLSHFTGDAVIIYMADASDSPEDVVRYYEILRDQADCAFGSRFLRGSHVYDYPAFKLFINRIANFVIRMMFGFRYNDTTNAFKGFRAGVIEGCRPFVSPHFNLTIELPLKAMVRGYSYKVIPISWRNREVGVSSLKLKEQGSRYLYTLLTVWFEWLLVKHDTKRTDDGVFQTWDEIVEDRRRATEELEAARVAQEGKP